MNLAMAYESNLSTTLNMPEHAVFLKRNALNCYVVLVVQFITSHQKHDGPKTGPLRVVHVTIFF